MANHPSSIRTNVNVTMAVSGRYAVSHDLINRYPHKMTTCRQMKSLSFSLKEIKKSLKIELVLGVIYMSVGVCVRRLHWQVDATERCIAGVIWAKHILLDVSVALRWPELIL